jgi:hypothetical protein
VKDGDFFLGENAVGQFAEPEAAIAAGRHRYEPYRGTGHLELSRALKRGERPRCWGLHGSTRVCFSVSAEEFIAASSKSEWWVTIEDVEVVEPDSGRLSSEKLAALIVDALADARMVPRPKIRAAIAIAAEEIELHKAIGDY